MAKKRVHEIAKEKGISSKEVLAILQKAGLDVKAAASSVDEDDVARAFDNGAAAAEEPAPAAKADGQQSDSGDGAAQAQPASDERPARARPTRASRAGEQAPGGGGGRRRRVVIDSQAAR